MINGNFLLRVFIDDRFGPILESLFEIVLGHNSPENGQKLPDEDEFEGNWNKKTKNYSNAHFLVEFVVNDSIAENFQKLQQKQMEKFAGDASPERPGDLVTTRLNECLVKKKFAT